MQPCREQDAAVAAEHKYLPIARNLVKAICKSARVVDDHIMVSEPARLGVIKVAAG
jgi:hypothetical protein